MNKFRETKKIAQRTINEYLPGWKFKFHRSGKAYGLCWYDRKVITLNIEHVRRDTTKEINDSIAHEIAHGICGSNSNHRQAQWLALYEHIKGQL